MKYVSTILLILAMYWSWGLTRNDQAVSQQAHMSIQNDVKQIIADYIQQNSPNATNLRFERFWTEALTDNQVKVTFTYSFEEAGEQAGATRLQIEGFAILNRLKDIVNGIEWGLDKIEVVANQLDYQEPMQVTPREGGDAVENKPEPTPEKEPVKHE